MSYSCDAEDTAAFGHVAPSALPILPSTVYESVRLWHRHLQHDQIQISLLCRVTQCQNPLAAYSSYKLTAGQRQWHSLYQISHSKSRLAM